MYSSQHFYALITYFINLLFTNVHFIKCGVLEDYKAPPDPISKDSYKMIREMLCDFFVKDVISQRSFCYGPFETVKTCD